MNFVRNSEMTTVSVQATSHSEGLSLGLFTSFPDYHLHSPGRVSSVIHQTSPPLPSLPPFSPSHTFLCQSAPGQSQPYFGTTALRKYCTIAQCHYGSMTLWLYCATASKKNQRMIKNQRTIKEKSTTNQRWIKEEPKKNQIKTAKSDQSAMSAVLPGLH